MSAGMIPALGLLWSQGLFTVPINNGIESVVMAKIKGLSKMKSMIYSGGIELPSPGNSI